MCYGTWLFYVDSGDPNSVPQVCVTNALATVPSPQPYVTGLQTLRIIENECAQFPYIIPPVSLKNIYVVCTGVCLRASGMGRKLWRTEVSDSLELELQMAVSLHGDAWH